jgi:hypothetical protein
MGEFTLVCWSCSNKVFVSGVRHPQYAMDLVVITNKVGWVGVIDLNRSRTLVFCSDECKKAAKTKKGWYRKYSPRLRQRRIENGGQKEVQRVCFADSKAIPG